MGKGDKKTRKGKIAKRSYGNKRLHSEATGTTTATSAPVPKKPSVPRPAAPAVRRAAAPSKVAGVARKPTRATKKT